MNLQEEIEKIKKEGYNEANAEARLCQDIILKAISESSLRRNVTIKGGVVMRNLSGSVRRATQDIDLDFIKYSISDESIMARNTRYKDVIDIYFLKDTADTEKLKRCFKQYIYDDDSLSVNNMSDIVSRLEMVFHNKAYIREINRSKKNWIGIEINKVLEGDLLYFKSLQS